MTSKTVKLGSLVFALCLVVMFSKMTLAQAFWVLLFAENCQ